MNSSAAPARVDAIAVSISTSMMRSNTAARKVCINESIVAFDQRSYFCSMSEQRVQAIHIIGGGLAGAEAAWQIAARGVPVVLHEMRPARTTAAHKTAALAELVCSNSFRSDDHEHNAVGLLHAEMRRLGSLIMRAADAHQVPAGGALAVDRDGFADAVTSALAAQPLIEIRREEVAGLPPAHWDSVIVA